MKKSILFVTMMAAASGSAFACEDRDGHAQPTTQPMPPAVNNTADAVAVAGAEGGQGGIGLGGVSNVTNDVNLTSSQFGGSPSATSDSTSSSTSSSSSSANNSLRNVGNSQVDISYNVESDPIHFDVPQPRSLYGAVKTGTYAPRRVYIDGSTGKLTTPGEGGLATTLYGQQWDWKVMQLVANQGATVVCDVQNHGMRGRWHSNRYERYSVTDQVRKSWKSLPKATREMTKALVVMVTPMSHTYGAGLHSGVGDHDDVFTGIASGVASYAASNTVWQTQMYCLDKPMSVNFYPGK